jgi:hypothetical protein
MSKSNGSFAVNLGCFQTLATALKGFGNIYAPAAASITVVEVDKRVLAAQKAATDFNVKHAAWRKAIDDRKTAYKPLRKYCTRMLRAFKALVKDAEAVETLVASKKKLDGTRIGKKTDTDVPSLGNDVQQPGGGTIAQTGFQDLANTFEQMMELAALHQSYVPNETDLQISGMQKLLADLRAANLKATEALNDLTLARHKRNEIHFFAPDSIWRTGRDAKDYVISLFGIESPEYKQIRGLRFRKAPAVRKKKSIQDQEEVKAAA